ncbi:MAG TPA: hypothetical protein VMF50_01150 [Candidatus Binataceae bacterium]|nr:hypothetical protein [Candidatus Binataceae bacterium]
MTKATTKDVLNEVRKTSKIDAGILASASLIIPTGCIDGYATEFNRQQHVNLIGSDLHVYELLFDNQWHRNEVVSANWWKNN